MKLRQLLKDIPSIQVRGSQEIEIKGISANSKNIAPGFLFITKQGKSFNGAQFIPEAIQGGAKAVLLDTYDPFLTDITQVIHSDPASLELSLAERFYDYPTQKLKMIGVTGTNGKTTTSYLIKYLIDQKKEACGLIGTVEWVAGKKIYTPTHTTPDTLTLMKLFSDMVSEGVQTTIMEVTSHALDQKRVQGIDFKIGVFTNLTHDHLDYHQTMEKYAAAKALLFQSLSSEAYAVVNIDDPTSSIMIRECKAKLFSYGMQEGAHLYATDLRMTPRFMGFNVHYEGRVELFKTDLIGRFNVYNILAATSVALLQGMSLKEIKKAIAAFKGVPGRLERVANMKDLQIFVDYSHKPDALEKVLKTLGEFKQGKIITVYGCGGNRDALKRPIMGSIVERFSDIAILTSDNPRGEDPQEIARQVLKGCLYPEKTILELDRRKAIEEAIRLATPQDMILIAGKGHETTQIFAHRTIQFDDRLVAKDACRG